MLSQICLHVVYNFKLYFCLYMFLFVSMIMICLTNIVKVRQFLIKNKPVQKVLQKAGRQMRITKLINMLPRTNWLTLSNKIK